jgi:hypothetical protein
VALLTAVNVDHLESLKRLPLSLFVAFPVADRRQTLLMPSGGNVPSAEDDEDDIAEVELEAFVAGASMAWSSRPSWWRRGAWDRSACAFDDGLVPR